MVPYFGELEIHPFTSNHKDHPEIVVIRHDENSKHGENEWHSDVTWREKPSLGSILRGFEIPDVGGDTLFADMYAAYEGLSAHVREKINGAYTIHSFEHNLGRGMTEDQRAKVLEEYPRARHPVVRTHPETGRKGLYVNAAFVMHLEHMEADESAKLLRRLCHQAATPEYQCRFRWRKHSVAFWDNRAVQHYAAFDYIPNVRHVERVTVIGDRPY
jgi:taurine dioxygenase